MGDSEIVDSLIAEFRSVVTTTMPAGGAIERVTEALQFMLSVHSGQDDRPDGRPC